MAHVVHLPALRPPLTASVSRHGRWHRSVLLVALATAPACDTLTSWAALPRGRSDAGGLLPASAGDAPLEQRRSAVVLRARVRPDRDASVRGRIAAFAPFPVYERADPTPGCDDGWGRVGAGAWTCLDDTTATDATPRSLPQVLAFDPPTPEESAAYFKDGVWPRDDDAEPGVLPFVYGKRWMRWNGQEYASVDDFVAGRPLSTLQGYRQYAFTGLLDTPKGTVLTRPDGHVVPLDGVYLYAVSRLRGVELALEPPPRGAVPGWAIATRGVPVRALPETASEVTWTAEHHRGLWVEAASGPHKGWLRVIDRADAHPGGWVRDDGTVRWWHDAPPPEPALAAAPEVWLDVDLDQQMLAVRRGALPLYVTLVATGSKGHETPTGLYRVFDKAAWWDMASLPESTQPYFVESVPWVMHFWPRYALHGAFWHNRFGQVTSHGCINLAPYDAAWIFDAVHPTLPPGWLTIDEAVDDPGTLLRVREGSKAVVDRRRGF